MALLRVDHHEQRGKCWKCRHHFGRCLRSSFKIEKRLDRFCWSSSFPSFCFEKSADETPLFLWKMVKKTKGTSINITEIPKQGGGNLPKQIFNPGHLNASSKKLHLPFRTAFPSHKMPPFCLQKMSQQLLDFQVVGGLQGDI